MWELSFLDEIQGWRRICDSPTGDRAKRVARQHQIAKSKNYKYRILDPSKIPWMYGTSKITKPGFIMVWNYPEK